MLFSFLFSFAAHADFSKSMAAAQTVASTNIACSQIKPFYWEIGDSKNKIASGHEGSGVDSDTDMGIASASKLMFASYVVEKRSGQLSASDIKDLSMQAGYTNFTFCPRQKTVGGCFEAHGNDKFVASTENHFFYNGGNFQKLAVDIGLGAMDKDQLASEYKKTLGNNFSLSFKQMQVAGGVGTTPSDYAQFLRNIISGKLKIKDLLGTHAVCTLPGTCKTALESPAIEDWHYSLGHWVEDAAKEDGAFSSPGAFGFYPWISADKKFYGIVARVDRTRKAYVASAACGKEIRKAFLSAQ